MFGPLLHESNKQNSKLVNPFCGHQDYIHPVLYIPAQTFGLLLLDDANSDCSPLIQFSYNREARNEYQLIVSRRGYSRDNPYTNVCNYI